MGRGDGDDVDDDAASAQVCHRIGDADGNDDQVRAVEKKRRKVVKRKTRRMIRIKKNVMSRWGGRRCWWWCYRYLRFPPGLVIPVSHLELF